MAICTKCGVESPEGFQFCGACGSPLGVAPRRVLRKMVSVLFCDVSGSTALGERLDPEALRGVMATYFGEIRAVVERHGGVVEKFIGDAVMAVFGVPQAHEDDALRAVRAAAEIRDRMPAVADELGVALRFRTGVNTGEAVVGTDDVLATGDAVNVAARLEQAAAPGEILIGASTYTFVRDAVEAEQIPPLVVKGKSEPLDALRLDRVDPIAPGRARRLDAPLVGRDRELNLLCQAYERAVGERRCHLFTLLGAAGVGKSRLIRAFTADVASHAVVVSGRCLPYGDGITFWPLVEILRPLGDLAEPVLGRISEGAIASPNDLFWDVRKVVEAAAADRPLVVVFDDLQWGEPLLLDVIEHVAKLSRGAALLFVCVARPELLDDRPTWSAGTLNATAILLEPLAEDECRELIGSLDAGFDQALAERVIRASEGNPLFVEEMVALAGTDGSTTVPPTIHAVLTARLEQLDEDERVVLECGAVEGEVFHRGAVSALVPASPPRLDSLLAGLVQKEIVRPTRSQIPHDEAYRFSHLLIRDAAYDAAPKARRAQLHNEFANWLEAQNGALVELDQIAGWHLEQAIRYGNEVGRPSPPDLAERAADHLASAGRIAGARMDLRASESLFRRALALVAVDSSRWPMLAVEVAEALTWRGQFTEADELLSHEATVAGAGLYATLARCRLLYESGEAQEADIANDLSGIYGDLVRTGDERALARAEMIVSAVHSYRLESGLALAALDRAVEHARKCGERHLLVRALSFQISHARAGPESRRAVEARLDAIEQGDAGPAAIANLIEARGVLAQYDGRFDDARRLLKESHSILVESGDDIRAAAVLEGAELEMACGDYPAAIRILEQGRADLARLGMHAYRSTHTAHLACALYAAGRLDDAERVAAEAEAETASDDIINLIIIPAVRAHIAADRGRSDMALGFANTAVEIAYRTEQPLEHARAERALAHALAAAGRGSEAIDAARRALVCYHLKGDTTSAVRMENWIVSLASTSPPKTPA